MSLRALIVTPYADTAEFRRWTASRMLLRGLDELEIGWTLHQPWNALDVRVFDVIVCWSYGYRINNFPQWARRFEASIAGTGTPVVNSVRDGMTDHHYCLTRWAAAGVPCARVQRMVSLDDISLDYPLILRIDGQHQGRDMYLARDADEARRIVASRRAENRRPLNLAIEYVNTRHRDGRYRKWRSYVIGGQVMPHLLSVASEWTVNGSSSVTSPQFIAERQAFWRDGEPEPELLIRAASALASDAIALDYHRDEDGRYTFFEGNRNFIIAGDPGTDLEKFLLGSGRSHADLARANDRLSRLLGQLVADRATVSRGEM